MDINAIIVVILFGTIALAVLAVIILGIATTIEHKKHKRRMDRHYGITR